jgi:hypothetical protein
MTKDWPPEFDGIKVEQNKVLARVKDTDIWLELDSNDSKWIEFFEKDPQLAPLLAWLQAFA